MFSGLRNWLVRLLARWCDGVIAAEVERLREEVRRLGDRNTLAAKLQHSEMERIHLTLQRDYLVDALQCMKHVYAPDSDIWHHADSALREYEPCARFHVTHPASRFHMIREKVQSNDQ